MRIEASEVVSAEPGAVFHTLAGFEGNLKRWARGVVSVESMADGRDLPTTRSRAETWASKPLSPGSTRSPLTSRTTALPDGLAVDPCLSAKSSY
jgi:hypothetical protein